MILPWIPGHGGIIGNEHADADRLAKQEANMEQDELGSQFSENNIATFTYSNYKFQKLYMDK